MLKTINGDDGKMKEVAACVMALGIGAGVVVEGSVSVQELKERLTNEGGQPNTMQVPIDTFPTRNEFIPHGPETFPGYVLTFQSVVIMATTSG
jgi:hypothetical protein